MDTGEYMSSKEGKRLVNKVVEVGETSGVKKRRKKKTVKKKKQIEIEKLNREDLGATKGKNVVNVESYGREIQSISSEEEKETDVGIVPLGEEQRTNLKIVMGLAKMGTVPTCRKKCKRKRMKEANEERNKQDKVMKEKQAEIEEMDTGEYMSSKAEIEEMEDHAPLQITENSLRSYL